MKKLFIIILSILLILNLVSCDKEAAQETESSTKTIDDNDDDVIMDHLPKWYATTEDEYQTFLENEKDFLPENYIPYTQLPYPEDIEYIAAWFLDDEWVFHYRYSNDLKNQHLSR